jgi:hypothetical protein
MRCAIAGAVLLVAACAGAPPPSTPPPPRPAPVATVTPSPVAAPFSRDAVARAVYAPLFEAGREWKLSGIRHVVTAGDRAGSLHYKVIVRCRVADVVAGPSAIASRVECVNFPEDSVAINPLDRVWVAGRGGLYRADEIPTSDAGWSAVWQGRTVLANPPQPLEQGEECRERVTDTGEEWCWSESCAGDPTREGKLCFSKQGALVSVAAHSMAETSDVLVLSVVPGATDSVTQPDASSPAEAGSAAGAEPVPPAEPESAVEDTGSD